MGNGLIPGRCNAEAMRPEKHHCVIFPGSAGHNSNLLRPLKGHFELDNAVPISRLLDKDPLVFPWYPSPHQSAFSHGPLLPEEPASRHVLKTLEIIREENLTPLAELRLKACL